MKDMGSDARKYFLPAAIFDINNLNLAIGAPVLFIICGVLLFLVGYRSNTRWGFWLRKKIHISFRAKDMSRYKSLARILFVDDKDIPMVSTLTDENWSVGKSNDVRIDDSKVKEANIIFVDWKGVGRGISSEEEGMALASNLKAKYGHTKYIVLYTSREYQKPAGLTTDDWINKGSTYDTYLETIQRACFALFG